MSHEWVRVRRHKNKKIQWYCHKCEWYHESYSVPSSTVKFSFKTVYSGAYDRSGNPVLGWGFWMDDQDSLLSCDELIAGSISNE